MTNDVANQPKHGLGAFFRDPKTQERLQGLVPTGYDAGRLLREAAAAVRANPQLHGVDPGSFGIALMTIGQLGLGLGPEQLAYLIPRRNKRTGTMDATVQVGYRGWIKLGLDTGAIADVEATVVYENDQFRITLGNGTHVEHTPNLDARGAIKACYAIATLPNGATRTELLRREDIAAIRAKADPDSAAWRDFPDMMVRKAAIKRLVIRLAAGRPLVQRAEMIERAGVEGLPIAGAPASIDEIDITPDRTIIDAAPDLTGDQLIDKIAAATTTDAVDQVLDLSRALLAADQIRVQAAADVRRQALHPAEPAERAKAAA